MSEQPENGAAAAAAVQEASEESSEAPPAKKLKPASDADGGDDGAGVLEDRDFDEETQKALEEIDTNQNEIDLLNEKASEEILKVEQKYNKLRRPFYDKRNGIIARIPKFWLTAFINHPQISQLIEEDEEDALQHLTRVEVEEFEDIKSGYSIKLHFDAANNPYFENETLVKEILLSSGEPTATATTIKWKEGQDLSAKAAVKAKASSKARLMHRTFFTW